MMKNNMRHRQKYGMMGKGGGKKKNISPPKKAAKPAQPVIGRPKQRAAPFPSGGKAGKAMSPWPSTGNTAASAMRAAGKPAAKAPQKQGAGKAMKKAPPGGRLGKMLQKMTGSLGKAVGRGLAGGMGKGRAAPGKGKKKGLPRALGKALEKSPNGVGGLLGKGPGKGQGGKALFKDMVGNGPKGVKELGKAGPKAAKGAMELLGDMLGKGPGGVISLGKDPKAAAGTRELVKHGMKHDPAGMKKAMGKGPRAEEGTKELFGNVLGKAKDGLGAFWGKAKGAAKGIFGDALGTAKETAGNVKHAITGTFGELKDAYGENWGAASKQEEPGGKKRSGWDKAWDFAGKVFGTGGKVVQKARTELAAGAVKLASQGVGRVADLVSTGLGDKARAAGGSLSEGVRKIGNGAADFRGDLIHGAIAGDSIKDPNAAQIAGNIGMSFIPVVGQVADARDVVGGMAAKDPARTLFAGLGFIPAAGDVLKQSDHIPKLMKHGSKPVDALAGGMKKLIDKVPAGIRKRAGDMWTGAKQKAGDMWTGAKQKAGDMWTGAKQKAGGMWTGAKQKAGDMWTGAKQKAGDMWTGAKQKAGDIWAGAKQKAGDMWTGGKQKTTEAKDWLISKFTKGDNKANTKGTSGASAFGEMSPEDAARYNQHWDNVASGNQLPPGMDAEGYAAYQRGAQKLDDAAALNKVDYDEISKLRAETKVSQGTSGAANLDIDDGIITINPNEIRYSQSSVNGSEEIIQSMKQNGWKGDPIDIVEMPDGIHSTIDNTRVVSAREAGIDVQANVRNYEDVLPDEFIERFTTKKGVPKTWGEAIELRVGKQKASFRKDNPYGRFDMETIK